MRGVRMTARIRSGNNHLSDMGQRIIKVRCDQCDRRGVYRADRLLARFGDMTGPEVLLEIGKQGGCPKAINPPPTTDINYNDRRCRIMFDLPPVQMPQTLGRAMHERWRGFIRCERHHQGLKATKPCGVEAELDLPTLVAALGHDFEVSRLKAKLSAPCCGSRSFGLTWYQPAAAA